MSENNSGKPMKQSDAARIQAANARANDGHVEKGGRLIDTHADDHTTY